MDLLLVDREPVGTERQPAGRCTGDQELVGIGAEVVDPQSHRAGVDPRRSGDTEVALGDRDDPAAAGARLCGRPHNGGGGNRDRERERTGS